ncbi:MAG TPA: hypothetical protein VG387_06255 [Rhizomicrobium sp.]|jgi:hypothetical protein|nr:hypothetical protein [Rhizomicrobium sp.]
MTMQEYAQKKAAFERATAERTQLLGRTHEIVTAMMKAPDQFHFSSCQSAYGGFPPGVAMGRGTSVPASEWPTAQQIQDVLVRWHAAREDAMNAWRALPKDEQSAMQPPEPFYQP